MFFVLFVCGVEWEKKIKDAYSCKYRRYFGQLPLFFFFLSIPVFCIYACNTCECGPFFLVVKPKSAEFKLLKLNT